MQPCTVCPRLRTPPHGEGGFGREHRARMSERRRGALNPIATRRDREGPSVCARAGSAVALKGGSKPTKGQLQLRGEADETDLALRATGRPPSRTPLSQSASALLDVKASNLAVKVHQNCAGPRLDLPSSTWQQLGHLGFMLHACRAWLHRQLSLLVSRLGRFSSTASRAMSQG